jgi:hypothetical protein
MNRLKEIFMRRAVRARAFLVPLLLLVAGPRLAGAAPGGTGFAFLKLGVGARAMGMGSAYVALADDPTASYWNPAGLASVQGTQVTVMHNEWIVDFRQGYAAVGTRLGPAESASASPASTATRIEEQDIAGTADGALRLQRHRRQRRVRAQVTKGLNAGAAVRSSAR